MKTMDYAGLELAEVLDEADAIAADANTLFGHLNAQQINWKPSPDQWSVAQCLEHLIKINREYYPQFDQIIKGEKETTLWQSMPVLPSLFGRMMVKALSPNFNQKLKALQIAHPTTSAIDPQIVNRFVEHQRELMAKFRAMERLDLAKIVITSPFAKALTYSVLDTGRLLVAHERRHFAQAQRVMEPSGFPKSL
jgi:DinB superfamily